MTDWVASHEPYGENLHRRANVVAHISQIHSPGMPDRELATELVEPSRLVDRSLCLDGKGPA